MIPRAEGPFVGGPEGVPLAQAPLVRVLCQAQWPEQTLLSTSFGAISDEVALAIASEYPTRMSSQPLGLEFDPQTGQLRPQALPQSRQWSSLDESWAVYFTPTFVTLENRGAYTSSEDMIERFTRVLVQVEKAAQIPAVQRIGWRYVNRISEPADLANISGLVHEAVLGARAIPVTDGIELQHAISDSLFHAPEASLGAKWGILPAGAAYDQNIQPVATQSWFLDLDAFRDERVGFVAQDVAEKVKELAAFAYRFFRWAVRDEFIDRFGGRK